MGRVRKLSKTLSYGSRWKTQQNAFLWVALENSAKRFPMGRVGKLSKTLSYGSRFRSCVVLRDSNLESVDHVLK
nr:hypothetical protein [Leptospira interrogans]